MRNLTIYWDDSENGWYAALADEFELVAKYKFAGADAAAQRASVQAMAQRMSDRNAIGWNDLFDDVDGNEVPEVGMQLLDAEQLLYLGAAGPVWEAPAAEPTMTILIDIEAAGEDLLEALAA
jgi:hypothetical protein